MNDIYYTLQSYFTILQYNLGYKAPYIKLGLRNSIQREVKITKLISFESPFYKQIRSEFNLI